MFSVRKVSERGLGYDGGIGIRSKGGKREKGTDKEWLKKGWGLLRGACGGVDGGRAVLVAGRRIFRRSNVFRNLVDQKLPELFEAV